MEFLDARRLTGPSLLFDGPAAVMDVSCTVEEADRLERVWLAQVKRMNETLGWAQPEFSHQSLSGGVSLAFTAAIDALYAASEINEWAWAECAAEFNGAERPDFEQTVADLKASAAEEANASLLALQTASAARDVTFLWDDDEASLGLGRSSNTWPVRKLPEVETINWDSYSDVPIGLVTGTNGKTTTVRLATHILRVADLNVGLSSTDWIAVNDHIIERGDWSGPGGARAVLRQNEVDVAILESARGGLLRRGLGVERADAALITNIAEDHLGDFGSQNLAELLDIKWIVSRAVREHGRLILNADDNLLVGKSSTFPGEIVWFGLSGESELVATHTKAGGLAFILDGDELVKIENGERELICRNHEIPIALGGAARHNVANGLAAAALTWCLGSSLAEIRAGLTSMSQDENPGRCNVYSISDFKVLVDFAHNPHAMEALFDMSRALPAKRRLLAFAQAGDRTDASIRELAESAWSIGLDAVVVSELEAYARGREQGEVFGIIRDALIKSGASEEQIAHYMEETESLDAALDWAQPGDLVIMLALSARDEIQDKLKSLANL